MERVFSPAWRLRAGTGIVSGYHDRKRTKAAGGHNQRIRPPVESRKSKVKVHMRKLPLNLHMRPSLPQSAAVSARETSCYLSQGRQIKALTCECLKNPIGVEAVAPRLSWQLEDDKRNQAQTAYRLLVASSQAALDRNEGDLWDTGKIVSDQSTLIEYAGRKHCSRQYCCWKVKAWNNTGTEIVLKYAEKVDSKG